LRRHLPLGGGSKTYPLTQNPKTVPKETWAERIECSYVPLELIRELTPPATPRPWWGFGTSYAKAPAGNEWIINHYLLSKHGIALERPDFNELIPPIDIHTVRQASARDLFQEWVPKIDDGVWLSNSLISRIWF
jgi:hypothetical protein